MSFQSKVAIVQSEEKGLTFNQQRTSKLKWNIPVLEMDYMYAEGRD